MPSLGSHSPLRDRVFKSTSKLESSKESSRGVYQKWTNIGMREALDAVKQRGVSVSKASCMYGIPRSTLNDHLQGRVLPGAKAGAPTLLTIRQEEELVKFLVRCAELGIAKTKNEVINLASRILHTNGDQKSLTEGWWRRFISRHHDALSLRIPAKLSHARLKASSRSCIDNYFDAVEHTLKTAGLWDYPSLVFNMDESGFPLDPKTVNVRGSKNPFSLSTGDLSVNGKKQSSNGVKKGTYIH